MSIKPSCFLGICLLITVISTTIQAQQIIQNSSYKIPIYNFNQIEPLFNPATNNDTVYIFNFWATYCAPCIKELPHFEKIGQEYTDKKVKIILVSLDFKSQIESRVIPFLQRRNILSEVVVLSDPDANSWIDKVNPNWSGAIPATLIVKGNRKEFYEKEFTYEEIKSLTNKFLE